MEAFKLQSMWGVVFTPCVFHTQEPFLLEPRKRIHKIEAHGKIRVRLNIQQKAGNTRIESMPSALNQRNQVNYSSELKTQFEIDSHPWSSSKKSLNQSMCTTAYLWYIHVNRQSGQLQMTQLVVTFTAEMVMCGGCLWGGMVLSLQMFPWGIVVSCSQSPRAPRRKP